MALRLIAVYSGAVTTGTALTALRLRSTVTLQEAEGMP